MTSQPPLLSISEAKSKELVPCVGGTHLHSLHNPRREAEVFASNHLAHLSKTPNALILGLGFSYHIEEIIKILSLKHKSYRIGVIEAVPELVRLSNSYRGEVKGVEVFTAPTVNELWRNKRLGQFLLEKPVVIIHPASFNVAKDYYETFLKRRAPSMLGEWELPAPSFANFFAQNASSTVAEVAAANMTGESAAWMRAFWECKHAD